MGGADQSTAKGQDDDGGVVVDPPTFEFDSGMVDDTGPDEPVQTGKEGTSEFSRTIEQYKLATYRHLRRLTGLPFGDIETHEFESSERFSQEENPELLEHPTAEAVVADIHDYYESSDDLPFEEKPNPDKLETRFFDFGYLDEFDEIERKWVNEPYAYVSVVHDTEDNEYRYRITEPYLDEFERYIFKELTKVLRNSLMYQDFQGIENKTEVFVSRASELIKQHTAAIPTISMYKLMYYLERNFLEYDRITPLLEDDAIEDISCDGYNIPVFVYHKEYRDLDTNVQFSEQELSSFVTRMAQSANKHISVSNPLIDASLPNGSRIQLSLGGDIATRGPNFTIRQFTPVPDTPIDLIKWGTFTLEQMAYFWLALENNRSLIFAGGTGAGKTTSLNAISFFIPKKSKIVTIEDTPEISLPHENWVQGLTREPITSSGEGAITMYEQLQTALRQRPEYILVGEIRTEPTVAHTFFQAMATGHSAYTTIHSESVIGVINRLENEPISVPTQLIKELDIISIQKQVLIGDSRVRRNDRITELIETGNDSGEIHISEVFEWNPDDDSFNTKFNSHVFDEIAADRGWTREELQKAYDDRRDVLSYLVENNITWYEDVARVIHQYMINPDEIMDQIQADTLDPTILAGQ